MRKGKYEMRKNIKNENNKERNKDQNEEEYKNRRNRQNKIKKRSFGYERQNKKSLKCKTRFLQHLLSTKFQNKL